MARRIPRRRGKGLPTAERAVPAGRARRRGRGRADIFEEALLGDTEVVDNRRNPDCGHSAVTEDHMHALRRGALFPCEDGCIDAPLDQVLRLRSEERRVGKVCVRTSRPSCTPSHYKKKYKKKHNKTIKS